MQLRQVEPQAFRQPIDVDRVVRDQVERPVSEPLAAAYRAAGAMFVAGTVEPARDLIAMNFLLDRDAGHWSKEIARLKSQVGDCETASPITPTGALSGDFTWTCAHGRLGGSLLLAPTRPERIQALDLSVINP